MQTIKQKWVRVKHNISIVLCVIFGGLLILSNPIYECYLRFNPPEQARIEQAFAELDWTLFAERYMQLENAGYHYLDVLGVSDGVPIIFLDDPTRLATLSYANTYYTVDIDIHTSASDIAHPQKEVQYALEFRRSGGKLGRGVALSYIDKYTVTYAYDNFLIEISTNQSSLAGEYILLAVDKMRTAIE